MYRLMPSKTVSLENSAYDRLKAAKRGDESFSQAVNRILSGSRPSFRSLAGSLTARNSAAVKAALTEMRRMESVSERLRVASWRNARGRNRRQ